jgi:hypothetical protein
MTSLSNLSPDKLRALAVLKQRGVDVGPLIQQVEDAGLLKRSSWPTAYINNRTAKGFSLKHHPGAQEWLDDRTKRYYLAKGGEGSGKSVIGIARDLEYLKLGEVTGILASPDLPHFKKSLWPEFKAWCPIDMVIPGQRYRLQSQWEPHDPFTLTFTNGSQLICGGMEDPAGWEGPNVHFAHLDEARRKKTPDALKVLDGRVRLPLPDGSPPAVWFTTTPRKNWLFEYFGPLVVGGETPDPRAAFKADALVLTLKTINNERAGNLARGYTEKRGQSLTESEKRVLQEAEWEDIDEVERFLPSIILWDGCLDRNLPALDQHQPMVLAADAGVTNDCFALTGVTRHPGDGRSAELAARYSRVWVPRGKALDFDAIEAEIVKVCERFNVIILCYDKFQLHQMMTRLNRDGVVTTREFSQQTDRAIADKQLLDLIVNRRIWHDGSHTELRKHLDNADRKVVGEDRAIRLVKREDSLKIDLAVALSMASAQALRLNLW